MFEEMRKSLIQPDVEIPKGGMFSKYITVRGALERSEKRESRSRSANRAGGGATKQGEGIQQEEVKIVNKKTIKESGGGMQK